ncbi:MAG: hypothetical protein CVV64_11080 [Candidatus Wallbacteria bacterium HGW-Wallbacteria-1]|uniref:Uncharacterized protein n=1 Tax=Candidatus Wallbacteria bacterium HGW-Wallbacteria-1 TaxID=2013854 RepID=A0A2N1PNY5_9BACT|nr:MAG: hypothetical protein CVV64_11080 [Candidatus Wallbacteria bacterium HGW-Wallbacteria-1]
MCIMAVCLISGKSLSVQILFEILSNCIFHNFFPFGEIYEKCDCPGVKLKNHCYCILDYNLE